MFHTIGFEYEKFKFPAGEQHVRLKNFSTGSRVSIIWEPSTNISTDISEEIIELLLLANAVKHASLKLEYLNIKYLPFGRQDRIAIKGECFSLEVMADLINSIGASVVTLVDPHSDVAPALIKNSVVESQDQVFENLFLDKEDFYLISPDGGALKKIYKLASKVNCCSDVVECSKLRNVTTGEITGVRVNYGDLGGKDCYIIDDICDGGRTFLEVAKELRQKNCGKVILCVTHGLFTKGLSVFDGIIDEIYTYEGKIK